MIPASFSLSSWLPPSLRFPKALTDTWVICTTLLLVLCLFRWYQNSSKSSQQADDKRTQISSPPSPSSGLVFMDVLTKFRRPRKADDGTIHSDPHPTHASRYSRAKRNRTRAIPVEKAELTRPGTKQPYDAFLVLDVEATCQQGTDFNFPNEIIEFPVCLMRWKDKSEDNKASLLEVVDEFRSFVKPTWRPTLSQFCSELTGITQEQVDSAPLFPVALELFYMFMVKNGLIDAKTGQRCVRFCWCSDGPYDIRDFVVKQCFISKVTMPDWIKGDVLDVRKVVALWLSNQPGHQGTQPPTTSPWNGPGRRSLNLLSQLQALGLPSFEGRQHSGIDDTRNIARIIADLARKGVRLQPNSVIRPDRRWQWMGKPGQVLEEYCLT